MSLSISHNITEDIKFNCSRCGACCKWEGFVRLTNSDILRISDYLNLSKIDFIDKYTILSHDRISLSLKEREDKSCIFLETGDNCIINPVKPVQCKNFPTHQNLSDCKAYNKKLNEL